MSVDLMAQALKAKVGNGNRKLVLVRLAFDADENGQCWASYEYLADQCEMGVITVKNHLKELEEAGFITAVGHKGAGICNLFKLNFTTPE